MFPSCFFYKKVHPEIKTSVIVCDFPYICIMHTIFYFLIDYWKVKTDLICKSDCWGTHFCCWRENEWMNNTNRYSLLRLLWISVTHMPTHKRDTPTRKCDTPAMCVCGGWGGRDPSPWPSPGKPTDLQWATDWGWRPLLYRVVCVSNRVNLHML